jgi:hypothetical protein
VKRTSIIPHRSPKFPGFCREFPNAIPTLHEEPRMTEQPDDPRPDLEDLRRRVFSDLQDCAMAWMYANDPLALCVAVTKADLPAWLVNALLAVLSAKGGFSLEELWRRRESDAALPGHRGR